MRAFKYAAGALAMMAGLSWAHADTLSAVKERGPCVAA